MGLRQTLRIAVAAPIGVAALLLAACGGSSSATSSAASSAPAASATSSPSASGKLTIWTEDYYVKIFQPLVKTWADKNGITVTWVTKDFGQMVDQFVQAVPAGQGPDLFVAPQATNKLVTNGTVAPVELGDATAGFNKESLAAFASGGKQYGVPFTVENVALYRNTKLVPQAPSSFDDLVAKGKALVAAGKAKSALGVGTDPKNGNPYLLMGIQGSFGNKIFGTGADGADDPAKLTIDDAAGVAFAQKLAQYGKDKVINPDMTLDIALSQFTKGQTPFLITGPWDANTVTKSGVPFAVEPIPSAGGQPSTPFVGNYGVYQSAKASNPLAAGLFLTDFMTGKDNQVGIWKESRNVPALTAAADEVSSDPVMKGFVDAGANAYVTPTIPAMDKVWGPWGQAQIQILRGQGGDPAAVWKKMGANIRAEIAKS